MEEPTDVNCTTQSDRNCASSAERQGAGNAQQYWCARSKRALQARFVAPDCSKSEVRALALPADGSNCAGQANFRARATTEEARPRTELVGAANTPGCRAARSLAGRRTAAGAPAAH